MFAFGTAFAAEEAGTPKMAFTPRSDVDNSPNFVGTNHALFRVGVPAYFAVQATGNPAPTYTLESTDLPSSLFTFDSSTGRFLYSGQVSPERIYAAEVRASNGLGKDKVRQFILAVKRQDQFITLHVPPSTPFTDGSTFVDAESTSFLPVLLNISTPSICTVSPTTGVGELHVMFRRAGQCSIVALQPGNNVYAPATIVSRSFLITPVRSFSAALPNGAGNASVTLSSSSDCTFSSISFVSTPVGTPPLPTDAPGYVFPAGLFQFSLIGCSADSTLTFTSPVTVLANGALWRYGVDPASSSSKPHWFKSGGSISPPHTVTFNVFPAGAGTQDGSVNAILGYGVPMGPPRSSRH